MATYVFSPHTDDTSSDWSDPTVWSGGVVPDGPNAAVELTSPGGIHAVTIADGQTFEVGSLDSNGGFLTLAGVLNVDGDLSLAGGAQLGLDGGALDTGGGATLGEAELSGNGLITGPVVDDGIIDVTPVATGQAVLVIDGPVSGNGVLTLGADGASASSDDNVLELGAAASVPVTFGAQGGVLLLDDPQDFTGTITPTVAPYGPPENASSNVLGGAATPGGDDVALAGLAFADVTSFTYGGDAEGGAVTIVGDGKTVTLNVANDVSVANFGLAAGPETSAGQPSVVLEITPALVPPTVALSLADGSSTSDAIVNTGKLVLDGVIPADANLQLTTDGSAASGSSSLAIPDDDPNDVRSYTDPLATALAPGAHEITATASGFYASAVSDPLELLVLPDPVDGVTTAAVSSFQFAGALDAGASMNLVAGTEAIELTDGTLSVGADTVPASVQRLYEGLLGRGGDAGGLAQFTALATASGTASVAAAMLGSPEFQSLHGAAGTLGDAQFVTLLYSGLLGRAPDAGGLAAYVTALRNGVTQADLAAGVADSPEAKAHLRASTANVWAPDPTHATVTELYQTAFAHAPDLGGLALFSRALQGGLSVPQLAQDLASSPEFLADHAGQDNAALVTSLYENGLGRTPSAADLQHWSGASAGDVLFGVAASPEAAVHLVRNV